MHNLERIVLLGRRCSRHGLLVLLGSAVWMSTSPVAWAAKKKVEQVVDESKGYTLPYLFVISLLGLGLMAVLRPSGRRDKADDKKQDDE